MKKTVKPGLPQPLLRDRSFVLSLVTVLGLLLGMAGTWLPDGVLSALTLPALASVYLAGGVPAAWRAMSSLWRDRVLDIDLLMVVAAVAAAAVGAPLEGAVLLTLFSVAGTMEDRALGRAPDRLYRGRNPAAERLRMLMPINAFAGVIGQHVPRRRFTLERTARWHAANARPMR